MRFVLPLVALCALSSAPLTADMFNITLTGLTLSGDELDGSGTFTTDGICVVCSLPSFGGSGLLSVTIDIGPDSGTFAFDITNDTVFPLTSYDRSLNAFGYSGLNSFTSDFLGLFDGDWTLTDFFQNTLGTGTYTVTAPEPRSLFLLMPLVAIVGLRWRHQRHRA